MASDINIITSFKAVKNYLFPVPKSSLPSNGGTDTGIKKDLSHYIAPLQLARLRHDVLMWREGIGEMEQAYYPQRVRVQRMYLDTVLNGQVKACMARRRRLTCLRDFIICDEKEKENEDVKKIFIQPWFTTMLEYIIDARAYGYSLIKLGDLVDGAFPDLGMIKRWNTSPERTNVTAYVYSLSGINFLEEPYSDWCIWVPTPNENGTSNCGYGYLYEVALYEITLRNLLGFNGDFVELYSQPYRVGKTMKTEGPERDRLEDALKNMGSNGWAITDPQDEIAFLETKLGGTGFQGYDNLEVRCEKKVSKLILGHADALDSVPGKLGSEQGGDESPVSQALSEIQTEDGRFAENIINNQVFDKLRNLGFNIPEGLIFKFKNDDEVEEFRRREDQSNLETANIALLMKNANLQMDQKYFSDRTGIPCKPIAAPVPTTPGEEKNIERIQNKLAKLYSKKVKV